MSNDYDPDAARVHAEHEARNNDPAFKARVKRATDWLGQTAEKLEGPGEMKYTDPESLSIEEREDREWAIQQVLTELDRTPRDREPDFLDPYRFGKTEMGGGSQEHAAKMRRSLGIDVGREPQKIEVTSDAKPESGPAQKA